MSNYQEAYRSRLVSHEELISRLRPGDAMVFGTWMGQPHGVMRALAKYGQGVDPLYVFFSPVSDAGEFLTQPNIRCVSSFQGPWERAARRERNNVSYVPTQYTDARKGVRANRPPDYLLVRVAPMDGRGCFNLSLSSSWQQDAIGWHTRQSTGTRIVVEVNPHMPRVCGLKQFGNHEVHIDDVALIVEDDVPLPDYPTAAPTATDRAIAANAAALVEDRATIQLGIGSIPMVIGTLLAGRKELGIHTEMFCQAHVDLIEAGCVTNSHKGLYDGVSVGTFALGEGRLYRWLAENRVFAMLQVAEVDARTTLARAALLANLNSILTIDLTGQACSHCLGALTYSGLGGAFEFAYGAQLSEGGKSILCLPSRTTLRDGRVVSNIVHPHPAGTRITIPEHCVDWVVTEYGAVRLKFLSLPWRAAALISIAHPTVRDELTRQARDAGHDVARLGLDRQPPAEFFRPSAHPC